MSTMVYVPLAVVEAALQRYLAAEVSQKLIVELAKHGTAVPAKSIDDVTALVEWLSDQLSPLKDCLEEIKADVQSDDSTSDQNRLKVMVSIAQALTPVLKQTGVSKEFLEALQLLPEANAKVSLCLSTVETLEGLLPDLERVIEEVVKEHQAWLKDEHDNKYVTLEGEGIDRALEEILRVLTQDNFLRTPAVMLSDVPGQTRKRLVDALKSSF